MKLKVLAISVALAFFGLTVKAPAASLIVDSGGQLLGATGVTVSGDFYDVEFIDDTCVATFDGCDNASEDFAFTTSSAAQAAAQALLDQVFLDNAMGLFNTDPELTNGCTDVRFCLAYVPFGFNSSGAVSNRIAYNYAIPGPADLVGNGVISPSGSLATSSGAGLYSVYARFTLAPIPEPGTVGLVVGALLMFASLRRLQRMKHFRGHVRGAKLQG